MAGTLISGQDPGGAIRPVQVDDNGNLELVYVSGSTQSVNIVGSTASQAVVGDVLADVADTGGGPVKIGGIARTANPTAVGNADRVSATYDDLGRQLIIPHQVRDLVATAYAQTATLAPVTLLSGAVGVFHDLLHITAANESGVAVNLDVRAVSAGSVVNTIQLAANATETITLPVPYPQQDSGNDWTIQNGGAGDISNTVVSVTALFVKNI